MQVRNIGQADAYARAHFAMVGHGLAHQRSVAAMDLRALGGRGKSFQYLCWFRTLNVRAN
jgi:hypothetical protein